MFRKLKKLSYLEFEKLAEMISTAANFDSVNKNDSKTLLVRLDYIEKCKIGRSTLHSLVAVDVYSSKTFAYPMQSRDLLTKKMQLFYQDI